MPLSRSACLAIAAVAVSAAAIALPELNKREVLSFETGIAVAYVLFVLNLAIAILGLWTQHRLAWFVYLVVSVAGMILIGSPTPLSALWILREFPD